MNMSLPEKEMLLSMLTEVYDQLEELEQVLEASFSDLRNNLNNQELDKISSTEIRISRLEKEIESIGPSSDDTEKEMNRSSVTRALKLEMGF
jgi:ferritin-like metal-binding protein YciE